MRVNCFATAAFSVPGESQLRSPEENAEIGLRMVYSCGPRDSPNNPAVGLVAATGRCPAADLSHEGKQVSDAPVVGDLSVLHTHHIN